MEIKYRDGLRPGGRRMRLALINTKTGQVVRFQGVSIPNVVIVTGSAYDKGGKWSNTTWSLTLAPGWAAREFVACLHQEAFGECNNFGEALLKFSSNASMPEFQAWLKAEYPSAFKRLETVENALEQLPVEATESVSISLCAPSKRAEEEGYWIKEREILGRTIQCNWSNRTEVEAAAKAAGIILTSFTHHPGHRGGSYHLVFEGSNG